MWLLATLLLASLTTAEVDNPPPPDQPDLAAARALVRSNDYAAAEKALAELNAKNPDDPELLLLRGEVLLAMAKPDQALPLLKRCAEIDPARSRVHFQLGTALVSTGDPAGALEAFGREIELKPDPSIEVMARLNRSLLFQEQKRWNDSASELQAVLALEPTRAVVYGDLVAVYLESDRLEDAARALEQGSAAGFHSAAHYNTLGSRFLKKDNHQAAGDAFRRAIEVDPTLAEAERGLAAALDKLGRSAESIEHLRRYLELAPDSPDAAKIRQRIQSANRR